MTLMQNKYLNDGFAGAGRGARQHRAAIWSYTTDGTARLADIDQTMAHLDNADQGGGHG